MAATMTAKMSAHGQGTSYPTRDGHSASGDGLAQFLGLFSIGLGLAELLLPRQMAELTGAPHSKALLQAYGLREITCGIGIIAEDRPAGWLWARVAGDALDLATLAAALPNADEERRTRLLASAAAVAGVTVLDVLCATQLSQ
jgi:hypothetical protein